MFMQILLSEIFDLRGVSETALNLYINNESDLDKTVKNLGFPVHGHERSSRILILGNNFSDNYQSKSIDITKPYWHC